MKAILMSIKPQWVQKILSGEKTIEVRKTAPEPPFKVYIYCTKDRHLMLVSGGGSASLFYAMNPEWAIPCGGVWANGKVVAEFVCYETEEISNNPFIPSRVRQDAEACLTADEMQKYLNGKNGVALHISALKVYDKSRELSFFGLKRPPQSWQYVEEME